MVLVKRARKEFLKELKSKSIELRQIQVGLIRCDETAVNTEVKKGVTQILVTSLQQPCCWLVCQLPTDKLLLCHVFLRIDAPTKRPIPFFKF